MDQHAQQIFDPALVRVRRNRIARQSETPHFLLDLIASEIADRLTAINRTFDVALCHNAQNGVLASKLRSTGQAGWIAPTDSCAQHLHGTGPAVVFDEEQVPLAAGSLSLYASALTLNHANDLPGALLQIRHTLRPDGLFIGALLGGDSLSELRQAFLAAETELTGGVSPRVAPFADIRDLGSLLQRAGFALPVVDADRLTVRYDTALVLMHELKAMALTSALEARSRTPMSRRLLLRAAQIYHDTHAHEDGRVPATFHIVYLTGWAPHESQQKPLKPGSAKQRLADALGTTEHKV